MRFLDGRLEEALLVRGEAQRDAARLAFEDQADAAEAALDGADRGDRADGVELRTATRSPTSLRWATAKTWCSAVGQGRLDRPQRAGAAGRDREGHAGEKNGVPHRNDRERLLVELFSAIAGTFLLAGQADTPVQRLEADANTRQPPGGFNSGRRAGHCKERTIHNGLREARGIPEQRERSTGVSGERDPPTTAIETSSSGARRRGRR